MENLILKFRCAELIAKDSKHKNPVCLYWDVECMLHILDCSLQPKTQLRMFMKPITVARKAAKDTEKPEAEPNVDSTHVRRRKGKVGSAASSMATPVKTPARRVRQKARGS